MAQPCFHSWLLVEVCVEHTHTWLRHTLMLIERRAGGGGAAEGLILLNDGSRVVKGEKVKREEEEKTGDTARERE